MSHNLGQWRTCPRDVAEGLLAVDDVIRWAKRQAGNLHRRTQLWGIVNALMTSVFTDDQPVVVDKIGAVRRLVAYSRNPEMAGLSNVVAALEVAGLDHLLGSNRGRPSKYPVLPEGAGD